jgi:hypothetical protein
MTSNVTPNEDTSRPGLPSASPGEPAASVVRAERLQRCSERPPSFQQMAQINPEIGLSILPILVFWVVGRFTDTEIAIAAAFVTSLLVFSRMRRHGVIGYLAVLGVLIVAGGSLVGIILSSDKAFLATDTVGDFITAALFAGSVVLRRPLLGLVICEMFPRMREWLQPEHRVFVGMTVLWVVGNIATGATRAVLLDSLSADSYILWSRVIVWPMNFLLFGVFFYLMRRAILEQVVLRFGCHDDGALPESDPVG